MTVHVSKTAMEIVKGYKPTGYRVSIGQNGLKFVPLDCVNSEHIHISLENSKTGNVFAWNFPIEYTCKHDCHCYGADGNPDCYACQGHYLRLSNQARFSENLAFFNNHDVDTIVQALQAIIDSNPSINLFRAFTCGDIPGIKFLHVMRRLAANNPAIRFWFYTKKYSLVNRFTEQFGFLNTDNLRCIFSHWMNKDGSFYPMENPYNYPTSEFIPFGMEDTIREDDHVCPCSNPNVLVTCQTCETPCYSLQPGQRMCLLEHSTSASAERDDVVRAAHDRIRAAAKGARK